MEDFLFYFIQLIIYPIIIHPIVYPIISVFYNSVLEVLFFQIRKKKKKTVTDMPLAFCNITQMTVIRYRTSHINVTDESNIVMAHISKTFT